MRSMAPFSSGGPLSSGFGSLSRATSSVVSYEGKVKIWTPSDKALLKILLYPATIGSFANELIGHMEPTPTPWISAGHALECGHADLVPHRQIFIHAPGLSKDGSKTRQPATLTDIYPTLCELTGLPIPKQCSGTSLVPQLKEPTTPKKQLALTSFQFWSEKIPSLAVADPRYRLIRYGNGFEELYDLKNDPHEFFNLADDPRLSKVKSRLARALPANVEPMRKIPTNSPYHRGRRRGKPSK